jgi:predicted site-specific integrase-resolvase
MECAGSVMETRTFPIKELGHRQGILLTRQEIAKALGVAASTVKVWRANGWLRVVAYNDKGGFLYEAPGKDAPVKYKWKKGVLGRVASQRTKGVQYEA